jgi:hypothetical protein
MANVDTDINNYNFNELTELLNVSNNGFSLRELESEYKKRLEINKELEDEDLKENLEKFFKNVYNFLIKHAVDFKNENNKKSNDIIENIDTKLNYLLDFNYKSKPEILSNVVAANTINQSNIPLNPRTYDIIKKQISINSEFRKKSANKTNKKVCINNQNTIVTDVSLALFLDTSTDFTIELPEIMDNVISMELVNTEIPNLVNTFSIRKGNYEFKITIGPTGGAKQITNIYIPTGVWIVSEFQEYLSSNYFDVDIFDGPIIQNEYLRYLVFEIPAWSAKPLFRFKTVQEVNDYSSTIPLDPAVLITLEYSIENVLHEYVCKNTERQFTAYKNGNENKINFGLTCLGTIGFDIDQVLDKGSVFGDAANPIIIKQNDPNYIYPPLSLHMTFFVTYNGYLQALKVYAYSAETALYVCVNDYIGNQGQQILLLGYDKTLTSDNILARVAVKQQPFQQNIYNSLLDYSIKREYYGGVRIRKLNIQIIDKYGRIVDLSDFPTNFVFEFTIQYSSERLAIFRNKM